MNNIKEIYSKNPSASQKSINISIICPNGIACGNLPSEVAANIQSTTSSTSNV